jgi:hypothetical protein
MASSAVGIRAPHPISMADKGIQMASSMLVQRRASGDVEDMGHSLNFSPIRTARPNATVPLERDLRLVA